MCLYYHHTSRSSKQLLFWRIQSYICRMKNNVLEEVLLHNQIILQVIHKEYSNHYQPFHSDSLGVHEDQEEPSSSIFRHNQILFISMVYNHFLRPVLEVNDVAPKLDHLLLQELFY